MAGKPEGDPTWDESAKQYEAELGEQFNVYSKTVDKKRRKDDLKGRRGPYASAPMGMSHGCGQPVSVPS